MGPASVLRKMWSPDTSWALEKHSALVVRRSSLAILYSSPISTATMPIVFIALDTEVTTFSPPAIRSSSVTEGNSYIKVELICTIGAAQVGALEAKARNVVAFMMLLVAGAFEGEKRNQGNSLVRSVTNAPQ